MKFEDSTIQDVVLVTQLPSDSWFAGFSMRPDGRILCTRADQPELYTLDTDHPDAEPHLVHTFPDATGLVNICPVPGAPDEYMVISGFIDIKTPKFDGFKLWRVALNGSSDFSSTPPNVSFVQDLDDCKLPLGIMPFSSTAFLIADALASCIHVLNISAGTTSVLAVDESMAPVSKADFFGVNRIRIDDTYVWYTNSSAGILGRIPIERTDDEGGIRTNGPIEIIATDVVHCDGLSVAQDKSAAYTASYMDGLLWKVTMDPSTGKGQTTVLMENLVSPTAVELNYTADGRLRLFVVCCGEIDVGWISEARSWSDMAAINSSVSVTVTTTEETVESGGA